MEADEQQIVAFLRTLSGEFVSGREIARRADGKKRFEEDRNWAVPGLRRLVDRRIVETDSSGHYRLYEKKV